MDIKLGHLFACSPSAILNVDQHFYALAHLRLCLPHTQVRVSKSRVTQAVAKRVERRTGNVPVARGEVLRSLRLLREVMRVVDGNLPRTAWPRYRQLAAGRCVAVKQISNCVPAFSAGMPGLEDRGHARGDPRDVERPTIDEHEHNRFTE